MARITLWKSGAKSKDYKFTDRQVSEYFGISGVAVYVHLYLGVYDQDDPTSGNIANGGVTAIEDVLLLENRDRAYSNQVYEMRGWYNAELLDPNLSQFGMYLGSDTLFVEFHYNDMLAQLTRKLMEGDVLEFPNQRDDALLNGAPAINKFYVVDDAQWASDGWSSTWYPHIWRCRCVPMTASQEFADILNQQATNPFGLDQGTIGDLMSTLGTEMDISNSVVAEAKAVFLNRNFETQQYYVIPGDETKGQYPWVWAGDGIPPDGATLAGSGSSFPINAPNGTYYLRTDYCPATLFQKIGTSWYFQEIAYRDEWTAAQRLLVEFINSTANTTVTYQDGTVLPERVALSKAVKPRADF